jgi:hypothetical protein
MTTDVEELLRAGISRLTAGTTVPDGLLQRSQQRHRRRRARIRAAAATAAAAALAVTLILALVPGPAHRAVAGSGTQTVADVISRADQALARAAARGEAIQEVVTTGRGMAFGLTVIDLAHGPTSPGSAVVPGVLSTVSAARVVTWTYRGLNLQEGFSAHGRLVYYAALGSVRAPYGPAGPVAYGAAYPARARWHTDLRGPGALSGGLPSLSCSSVLSMEGMPTWSASITKALACGDFQLDGRQRVDGVDAMVLVSTPRSGLPARQTIWLDPATYLPVRISVTFPSRHGPAQVLVRDFHWRPPDRAARAALQAALRLAVSPPGFRLLPAHYLPLGMARGSGR